MYNYLLNTLIITRRKPPKNTRLPPIHGPPCHSHSTLPFTLLRHIPFTYQATKNMAVASSPESPRDADNSMAYLGEMFLDSCPNVVRCNYSKGRRVLLTLKKQFFLFP